MNPPSTDVLNLFALPEAAWSVQPLGSGHIHRTYRVEGPARRYVLQALNERVFGDLTALMDNVSRVCRHLQSQGGIGTFDVLPARDGALYARDASGQAWRLLTFLDGMVAHDTLSDPALAEEAAGAFARFQRALLDLPGPPLHTILPGFHHTPRRFRQFEVALAQATPARADEAAGEIEFAFDHRPFVNELQVLLDADQLPVRIAHNDTKINNVLFDAATGRARAVIDLDTVMPGSWLYDFGDLLRTAACPAAEDERDLDRVGWDPRMVTALTRGFCRVHRDTLTALERQHLFAAVRIVCLEIGLRFLADHLAGDRYFAVHRAGHNLDRCRVQFRLVELLEGAEAEWTRALKDASGSP